MVKVINQFMFIFSIGITLIMLAYATTEIYPTKYCLICAAQSLFNVQYAACILVESEV